MSLAVAQIVSEHVHIITVATPIHFHCLQKVAKLCETLLSVDSKHIKEGHSASLHVLKAHCDQVGQVLHDLDLPTQLVHAEEDISILRQFKARCVQLVVTSGCYTFPRTLIHCHFESVFARSVRPSGRLLHDFCMRSIVCPHHDATFAGGFDVTNESYNIFTEARLLIRAQILISMLLEPEQLTKCLIKLLVLWGLVILRSELAGDTCA